MAERAIELSVIVPAPIGAVWDAWTTRKGLIAFFAKDCNIDIRPDGPYEIFFMPEAPAGQRGADGMRVLAVEHQKMLSFTWNAPPSLPETRSQRTVVILRFSSISENQTKLDLTHLGWGSDGQWDDTFLYFERAWGKMVLPNLLKLFDCT